MLYREYNIHNENDFYNLGLEINNKDINFTLFNFNNTLQYIYKKKIAILEFINGLKLNNSFHGNTNLLLNKIDNIFTNNKIIINKERNNIILAINLESIKYEIIMLNENMNIDEKLNLIFNKVKLINYNDNRINDINLNINKKEDDIKNKMMENELEMNKIKLKIDQIADEQRKILNYLMDKMKNFNDCFYEIMKFDYLKFENNSVIKSKIGEEKIYFSDKINKKTVELFSKTQERNLLVTNLAFYNLKEFEVKIRIKIEDLKGITISKTSNQFIIHCNQNYYDILYIYPRRWKLVKILQILFQSITNKDLLFCIKTDKDLSKYVVGKKEKLKNPYLFKIQENELTPIQNYLLNEEDDDIIQKEENQAEQKH